MSGHDNLISDLRLGIFDFYLSRARLNQGT